MAVDTYKQSDEEESSEKYSDEDSDKEELVNKPVTRERKKTQTELNKKVSNLNSNQFRCLQKQTKQYKMRKSDSESQKSSTKIYRAT